MDSTSSSSGLPGIYGVSILVSTLVTHRHGRKSNVFCVCVCVCVWAFIRLLIRVERVSRDDTQKERKREREREGHLCIQTEIQGALNRPRPGCCGAFIKHRPVIYNGGTQTWRGRERDFQVSHSDGSFLSAGGWIYIPIRGVAPALALTRPDFQAARPRVSIKV